MTVVSVLTFYFPGAALLQIAEVHKEINTQVIDNVSSTYSRLMKIRYHSHTVCSDVKIALVLIACPTFKCPSRQ